MLETLVLLSAFVGFVAGGAVVWRCTGDHAGDGASAPPAAGPLQLDALDHELERARRYERRFCILRLPVDHESSDAHLAEQGSSDFFASLRSIDVAWIDDDGVTILLPEVGRSEGETCVRRLHELAPGLAGDARLAVFPEDGLTRGALLEALASSPSTARSAAPEPASRPGLPRWAAS